MRFLGLTKTRLCDYGDMLMVGAATAADDFQIVQLLLELSVLQSQLPSVR
jgi:hypothetical protein